MVTLTIKKIFGEDFLYIVNSDNNTFIKISCIESISIVKSDESSDLWIMSVVMTGNNVPGMYVLDKEEYDYVLNTINDLEFLKK